MSHRPTVYGTRHAVSAGHYLAAEAALLLVRHAERKLKKPLLRRQRRQSLRR